MIDFDEKSNSPTWLHVEKADKISLKQFKDVTGFAFEPFAFMLQESERSRKGLRQSIYYDWRSSSSPEEITLIDESELFADVQGLMADFSILAGDLGRINNWGLYKGDPVIIDLGFTQQVKDQYYARH